jgi:hypothetical protein
VNDDLRAESRLERAAWLAGLCLEAGLWAAAACLGILTLMSL